MTLADNLGVGSNMRSVGSALAAGVKNLLPSSRQTPIARATNAILDNKGGSSVASLNEEESFAYLDPKLAPTAAAAGGHASRSRNPYSHAIVFVVGPGNYLEYQSLKQCVAEPRARTHACNAAQAPVQSVLSARLHRACLQVGRRLVRLRGRRRRLGPACDLRLHRGARTQ